MNRNSLISKLIRKSFDEDLNKEEDKYLNDWLVFPKNMDLFLRLLQEHMTKYLDKYDADVPDECEDQDEVEDDILKEDEDPLKKQKWFSKAPFWVAALVSSSVAASILLVLNVREVAPTTPLDIRNKVMLQLTNRKLILADTITKPLMLNQGNYQMLVRKNEVLYIPHTNSEDVKNEEAFNEISTPAGMVYKVILPDGSNVWLSACSSVRFSVAEYGRIRDIELSGEGYFEINSVYSEKQKVPFIVKVKTPDGLYQEVTVTGTAFNINAYGDESVIKTTLLEGRVKVASKGRVIWLSPGEELQVGAKNKQKLKSNIRDAIAWKEGLFSFNDVSLAQVVKELGRWYGKRIVFYGNKYGRISLYASRTLDIESLLDAICTVSNCKIINHSDQLLVFDDM